MLVNLHTAVIGKRQDVPLEALVHADGADGKSTAARRVWFEAGWAETPVYRREQLPPGATLRGPAIVEQLDSTTVVWPAQTARVDAYGNLILERVRT